MRIMRTNNGGVLMLNIRSKTRQIFEVISRIEIKEKILRVNKYKAGNNFTKIICFVLIFILIISISSIEIYAEDNKVIIDENISIESIGDIYKANSIQAKIDDINIELNKALYKQATEDADKYWYTEDKYLDYNKLLIKHIRPMEALNNLKKAQKSIEENLLNLKLNIYKNFQSSSLAQKQLEAEELKLAIMFERYELAKVKRSNGLITDNELLEIEVGIENKEFDIAKIKENIKSKSEELKRLLSIEIDDNKYNINIETSFLFEPVKIDDLKTYVKSAINNNVDVYRYLNDIELKQKQLDIIEQCFSVHNLSYISVRYSLEETIAALEEKKINIEVSVKNAYSNLLNQRDRVYLADKYVDIMKKKLDISELKYKNGVITKDALLSAREALVNAEYQRHSAVYSYNLIKADFQRLVK